MALKSVGKKKRAKGAAKRWEGFNGNFFIFHRQLSGISGTSPEAHPAHFATSSPSVRWTAIISVNRSILTVQISNANAAACSDLALTEPSLKLFDMGW
ncbi:hypothetical protein ACLOJK_039463 [Asimina triloba]